MPKKPHFTEDALEAAREVMSTSKDLRLYKMALAVALQGGLKMESNQVCSVLNIGIATLGRWRGLFRRYARGEDLPQLRNWGGRRRELLSEEDEKSFLQRYEQQSKSGKLVVVEPIHRALEERLGRPVQLSVVYRLLHRHGWRKVEPETHHPKRDIEKQEAFKKGGSRRRWRKLP